MTRCQFVPPYLLEQIASAHPDPDACASGVPDAGDRRRAARRAGARPPSTVPTALDGTPFAVHTAANGVDPARPPGARGRRAGLRRRGGRRGLRRGAGLAGAVRARCSAATSYDDQGAAVVATRALRAATTTTPSGTASSSSSATATARCSTGSPSRSTCSGTSSAHAVTEHTAGLDYQGQSGALNESMSDVFGVLPQAAAARPDRRRGRLADRRGHLPAVRAGRGRCGRWPSRARPTTTRCSARTRRSRRWPTTSTPRTTTAACTLTPASPTGPSTSPPPPSAARPGRAPAQIWYAALTSGIGRGHRLRRVRRGDGHRGGGGVPEAADAVAPRGRRSASTGARRPSSGPADPGRPGGGWR